MLRLSLNAPVQLIRDEEALWLGVRAPNNGPEAMINLNAIEGDIHRAAFVGWANHLLAKGRRCTGVKDAAGQDIYEGDIIKFHYNEHYGNVCAYVRWDSTKAAFICEGKLEGGAGFSSQNLGSAHETVVVGNVFEHPERLYPNKKIG